METFKAVLTAISEKCVDNIDNDDSIIDAACFKALLSKGLGVGIIAGSLLVKVPQILKILANRSGEGINLVSVLLDLTAITFHMAYSFVNGFPFSSWGDNTFLALQTAAIAALVLRYSGEKAKALSFIILYVAIVYVLCSGITPLQVLVTVQSCNIPILLIGKLSQAWTNYRNGSTGQLSAATVFLLFAGSLARIFTSIEETGDNMMIITFCASSFANGVIVCQMLYYWNRRAVQKTKKPKESKKLKSKKAD